MTKKCPFCLAEIPAEARKCKFCGEWVEKPPQPSAPEAVAPAAAPATPFKTCPACQAAYPTGALLCVQCGYDARLGTKRYVRYQPPAPPKEETPEPGVETTPATGAAFLGQKGKYLLLSGTILVLLLLLTYVFTTRSWHNHQAQYCQQSSESLRVLGSALQAFAAEKQRLPANICDKNGKPLLSWRVELLPYLDQNDLYKEFNLEQSWDGPQNAPLVARIPRVYAPGEEPSWLGRLHSRYRARPVGHTFFLGFVGKGTVLEPGAKVSLETIQSKDGLNNTVALVDAATAVPWTKPEDLPYDPNQPLPALGGMYENGPAAALLCDSTVEAIRPDYQPDQLKSFITYDDNQVADRGAVFGALPSPGMPWEALLQFWGPIIGGIILLGLLATLAVRYWVVMSD